MSHLNLAIDLTTYSYFVVYLKLRIDGIYVTKLSSTTGTTSTSIATPSDGKKRYLYIDWFSTDVKDWCLKYSAMKLAVSQFINAYLFVSEYTFDDVTNVL